MKKVAFILAVGVLLIVAGVAFARIRRSNVRLLEYPEHQLLENSRQWFFEIDPPSSWTKGGCAFVVARNVVGVSDSGSQIRQTPDGSTTVSRTSIPYTQQSGKIIVAIQLLRTSKSKNSEGEETFRISGAMKVGGMTATFENAGRDIVGSIGGQSAVKDFRNDQNSFPLVSFQFREGTEHTSYQIRIENELNQ
jgi:hypothetical protein